MSSIYSINGFAQSESIEDYERRIQSIKDNEQRKQMSLTANDINVHLERTVKKSIHAERKENKKRERMRLTANDIEVYLARAIKKSTHEKRKQHEKSIEKNNETIGTESFQTKSRSGRAHYFSSVSVTLDDEEFSERVSYARDPDRVYSSDETNPLESISLYAWREISKWRAKKEGSVLRKSVAELGYFGNGLFSIAETAIRTSGYWIVCNTTSNSIAEVINKVVDVKCIPGRPIKSYQEVKEECEKSLDKCIQAIAQNFVSIGTNLASHEKNMDTAHDIQQKIEGGGKVIIFATGAISPITIAKVIYTRDRKSFAKNLSEDLTQRLKEFIENKEYVNFIRR